MKPSIQLIAPVEGFSSVSARIAFGWKYLLDGQETNCEPLPENAGFEIRIWAHPSTQRHAGPLGATNAAQKYFCYGGIYSHTLGDITFAPGVKNSGANTFLWDVVYVQIDPYNILAQSDARTFYYQPTQ